MAKLKVLEVDEKMEKALKSICDSAFKFKGDEITNTINEISKALQDQKEDK